MDLGGRDERGGAREQGLRERGSGGQERADAGGLQLGTLFVDEGFGTLDPETLDAVMSELGRLSSDGRTVGIVSHVEELKQRVADRIEVRRRADGSSTLTSTVS
ncbi:P-loop NTPase family protein [Clavibacter michiganensis]|uniref:hypothetical protein n=1 Tax=Clavibacter michiganensis TaxID=28447 RepID=UPI0037425CD4